MYSAASIQLPPVNIQLKLRGLQTELFRKAIHILIAAVPFLAAINTPATMILVASGTLLYTIAEFLRSRGHEVFLISRITELASRDRDRGHFVLGPITLGIGAMLALMLYPDPAAAIAILALAFGDSISSLVGKLYGYVTIPFTGGKTYAGSFACFLVVLFVAYRVTGNLNLSILISIAATALEALPTRDLDNIIVPVGTGFIASQLIAFVG
ncbi:MAG: phosphatidate cytidylyltransferase [Spirochaetales bacterium]|nr:phosphatidate cytidylyltransferase [Spirochaetales bacterium]